MSMRSLGDFTKASSGLVVVCFDSDTIADRGTSCVQVREAGGVRTSRGHRCGLSHGHGQSPALVYGKTKWQGEQAVRAYARHLIVRTSWVYGEGRNFMRTIVGAARAGRALRVVDDQVGRPTYAEDVAVALRALVDAAAAFGTYHFQNAGPLASWADVAEETLRLAGEATRVERISTEQFVADRPGRTIAPRPRYSVLDLEKVSRFAHLRDWREALAEYVPKLKSAA